MAKDTVKLAGPDSAGNYRVLTTKGTMKVDPDDLLTRRFVRLYLLDERTKRKIDTTMVIPKYEGLDDKRMQRFSGTPIDNLEQRR